MTSNITEGALKSDKSHENSSARSGNVFDNQVRDYLFPKEFRTPAPAGTPPVPASWARTPLERTSMVVIEFGAQDSVAPQSRGLDEALSATCHVLACEVGSGW
ncbi:hypothetical protein OG308_16060 [Nocardia salmonicida]|uniref:Uncharacterized protein n=1 Tax=Nocardia salmonicida TaxID=53431 RepID=A0ABZ1NH88_9NOCA